jgi:hypothetical protein
MASNASAPDKESVFKSLSKLLSDLNTKKNSRGIILDVDFTKDKFIILSDHHKGNKEDGDDFASNEKNYLAALDFYFNRKFNYINLGDSEELWKYKPAEVIPKNAKALASEARFHEQKKYFKTFGNHDLNWKNKFDVDIWFKEIFILPLPVFEGLILKTRIDDKPLSIFVTHGHQGDKMSDNNSFSTWIISHIWRPLQRYLDINVNTPAKDYILLDRHNIMMYEWSRSQENLLLITGHTHHPVFASGLYSNHPSNRIYEEKVTNPATRSAMKPSYFNSGCCCYNDDDITGIEIADGKIALIKWHWENGTSQRVVLEEVGLSKLVNDL